MSFPILLAKSAPAVDSVRISLAAKEERWFLLLLISSGVVAIGCVLEVGETWSDLKHWWRDKESTDWRIPIAAIGLLLVIVGVVGEGLFEGLVSIDETALRAHDEQNLAATIEQAGTAQEAADKAAHAAERAEKASSGAVEKSDKASASASSALTIASGARTEADSFEKDIKTAKTQAADAESHLADALERAAHAETELKNIRSPRSLTNVAALTTSLARFKGTEYKFNVYQDDESIHFLQAINSVLKDAGWVRKPAAYHLGISSLYVFGRDNDDTVPVCIWTGIQVHVRSKNSSEAMTKLPLSSLPVNFQAAIALQNVLRSQILPPNDNNIGANVNLDPELVDEPMTICVGKKP